MQPEGLRSSGIALLLTSPLASALSLSSLWSRRDVSEDRLQRRNTTVIPAAINIAPSQYWDGNDGPWSSFALQMGNHVQNVRGFISTASNAVLTIAPGGCPSSYPSDCANLRGGTFDVNQSLTYIQHSVYDIGIEQNLGLDTNADTGFDTVTLGWQGANGPSVEHNVVFSVITPKYWVGFFGVNPRPVNFTTYGDPNPSFMEQLLNTSTIPSSSYAYTAGNQYRLNKVFGSLVLGGYDESRFAPTNVTFPFNQDISLDLSVQLKGITTNATSDSLLPDGQVSVFLDSTVAQLYLPESACTAFENAFGLVYDNATDLYLVNTSLHDQLTQQNPTVTFTIGPEVSGGDSVDITFPYGAFDLQVDFPIVENPNTSYYFPIKRAANSSQYVFGRTFFQEAYLIADYERQNFTVAPCTWDQDRLQNASIVSILQVNAGHGDASSGISAGAIAGIVVGVVVLLVAILVGILFWIRRKKQEKKRAIELEAKSANAEGKDSTDTSKPFISKPLGGELGGGEIHELSTPNKPLAQELDSPYKMDPNKAGYSEMDGGEFYPSGKSPFGMAEMNGSTPVFEMPGSEVNEMALNEIRRAEKNDPSVR